MGEDCNLCTKLTNQFIDHQILAYELQEPRMPEKKKDPILAHSIVSLNTIFSSHHTLYMQGSDWQIARSFGRLHLHFQFKIAETLKERASSCPPPIVSSIAESKSLNKSSIPFILQHSPPCRLFFQLPLEYQAFHQNSCGWHLHLRF